MKQKRRTTYLDYTITKNQYIFWMLGCLLVYSLNLFINGGVFAGPSGDLNIDLPFVFATNILLGFEHIDKGFDNRELTTDG